LAHLAGLTAVVAGKILPGQRHPGAAT